MKSDVITVIQSCQRRETGSSGIIYKEQDFVCILEKIGVKLLQKINIVYFLI
ncbi:unknown [Prevotella sp. CAG:1124]|nr:unknown [Prevotella sp. CAG:1124]